MIFHRKPFTALTDRLTEYAGEIRDRWPVRALQHIFLAYESTRFQDKRITIIQGDELLLNEAYPNSFRKSVARSVRKRDVTVILNDRVDDMSISDASIVTTRSGRKLVADLVVRHICQLEVNTDLLNLSPDSLSRPSPKQWLRYPQSRGPFKNRPC